MAKSLVVNKLGGKRKFIFLPCSDSVATTFASSMLDGEYDVFAKESETGTDNSITAARKVTAFGHDNTSHKSDTITFIMPDSKSDEDVITALTGKTFNGVKYDTVSVKIVPLSYSA
ncbi:MAG: hypothetical protein PHE67_05715 [Campylobacterales bacterium]|nr:hypothetical protein [Campylobacterales bacterium]